MEMTHDDVTNLLAALDGAPGLAQFDFACSGLRIQIERTRAGASSSCRADTPAAGAKVAARSAAKREAASPEGGTIIRAPMLGRFFREAAATQASFRVTANDVIGRIKAGERVNAVRAGMNGVAICLIVDGCLVEYDQELFIVTPISEG